MKRERIRRRFFAGLVSGLALGAALIMLVAQNTAKVPVRWGAWDLRAPLGLVVLVTMAASVLLGLAFGLVGRRRRQLGPSTSEVSGRQAPASHGEPDSSAWRKAS